jgi:hypothetical protein
MNGPRLNIVLTLPIVTVIAMGCSDSSNSAGVPPSGIQLVDLEGRKRDPWQSENSQAVVLVFTRSDCPISNRHAPDIRQLYERFHPRGVEFFLIYVDPDQSSDAIRAHMREYDYPGDALRDLTHAFASYCGVTITPEAVVFDRDKKQTYRGRINDLYSELGKSRPAPLHHDLADAIEATLAGRPVATPITTAVGCPIADLK